MQDRSIYLYRTRTTATEPCTQDELLAGQATNEIVRVTLAADDTVDLVAGASASRSPQSKRR